jgi:hypothetical protein
MEWFADNDGMNATGVSDLVAQFVGAPTCRPADQFVNFSSEDPSNGPFVRAIRTNTLLSLAGRVASLPLAWSRP